jgi:malate synthase
MPATIARAQLWFWIHRGAKLEDGRTFGEALYRQLCEDEASKLEGTPPPDRLIKAVALLDGLVLAQEFVEFLTLPAYAQLH